MTRPTRPGGGARLAELQRRLGADLIAVLALTAAADLFVLVPGLNGTPARPVFGLVFVLFVPGYAVVTALFPRPSGGGASDDADAGRPTAAVRIALAVVTSALVAAALGIALTFTPVGVRLFPLVAGLTAVTVGVTGYAAVRRSRLPGRVRPDPPSRGPAASADAVDRTGRDWTALDLVLAAAVVLALAGVGVAALAPSDDGGYTELYLVTENESGALVADGYPRNVSVGSERDLTLGVRNREGTATDYTVVVQLQRVARGNGTADERVTARASRPGPAGGRVVERTVLHRYTPRLDSDGTWRRQHTVSPPFAGERVRLAYLLYRGDAPDDPTVGNAYRTVYLWLTVTDSGDGDADRRRSGSAVRPVSPI
ncbi:DUF1616 domain-containing protein [Halostella salina]|uniref:DUF1616 domain-containing protein n=1 Tax=Halostella salina TaxID=1547897 RepID=UPI000EF7D100|nr:DUF1616 domain-containing protein [Halostella salina]